MTFKGFYIPWFQSLLHHYLGNILVFFPSTLSKSKITMVGSRPLRISKLVSVVNDHGDRCCPLRIGLWDPFQMAIKMACNQGPS